MKYLEIILENVKNSFTSIKGKNVPYTKEDFKNRMTKFVDSLSNTERMEFESDLMENFDNENPFKSISDFKIKICRRKNPDLYQLEKIMDEWDGNLLTASPEILNSLKDALSKEQYAFFMSRQTQLLAS